MIPKKKVKRKTEAQERRAKLKGEIAIRQRERRREKFVPSGTVIEFLSRMRASQLEYGRGQYRKLLKKEWATCFPADKFPNGGTSLQLIELKVGYWLQQRDINEGRRGAPSDMGAYRKKYRAAQRLDAAALPGSLGVAVRGMLKVESRDRDQARRVFGAMGSEKEGDMAAKKKAKKATPKVRKPSARGMVLDLLVKNNGAKLTDAALAVKVQKAFPGRKGIGAGYVNTLRKQLNAGDEKKKHGTPKPAIQQYGGKAVAAPKKKKAAKKATKKKAVKKGGAKKKKVTRRAKKS